MRPPWPNTTLNVGGHVVRCVAFSPCKLFLACGSEEHSLVHVWDRHGQHTRLEGHRDGVFCLQYSLDGRYLASGSVDFSIRLWCVTSESAAHSSSSQESRNRYSDIILLGHRACIWALAFSPTDSNLLASGCREGEIKLWDVINQVCIHAFYPHIWSIETIFFSPGDNIQCYVVSAGGPMIRIVRNTRMEFTATILEEPSLRAYPLTAFSPCGTCFAVYMRGHGTKRQLAMLDLRTMAKTQSVVLSGGPNDLADIAMSPDGKKLVTTNKGGEIRIFECHDLTIQTNVNNIEMRPDEAGDTVYWPVAFDPTSRVYAVGRVAGRVELRTI
jgi:WD40 repeat protein